MPPVSQKMFSQTTMGVSKISSPFCLLCIIIISISCVPIIAQSHSGGTGLLGNPTAAPVAVPISAPLFDPTGPLASSPVVAPTAPVISCPGNMSAIMPCVNGYWTLNSSASMNTSDISINGKIVIDGDLTLGISSSLSWQAYSDSQDFIVNNGSSNAWILSYVNVTGNASLGGSITVSISPPELSSLIGSNTGTRSVAHHIIEADNIQGSVTLIAPQTSSGCQQVSSSLQSSNSGNRAVIAVLFYVDSSSCNPNAAKVNRQIVAIVVPSVIGGILLVVVAVVLLAIFYPPFKRIVRPFSERKHAKIEAQRQSDDGEKP